MQSYNEDGAWWCLVQKETRAGILVLEGSGAELSGAGGGSILKQNIKDSHGKKRQEIKRIMEESSFEEIRKKRARGWGEESRGAERGPDRRQDCSNFSLERSKVYLQLKV